MLRGYKIFSFDERLHDFYSLCPEVAQLFLCVKKLSNFFVLRVCVIFVVPRDCVFCCAERLHVLLYAKRLWNFLWQDVA